MKRIQTMITLFALLLGTPALPMNKSVASACMMYIAPSKSDVQNALMQTGMVTAQMALAHPKIAPMVDKTAKVARQSAFVVPALVAYNSQAVTTSIMNGLQIAGSYLDELKQVNTSTVIQELPRLYPQLKNIHPLLGVIPDQAGKINESGFCSSVANVALDKTLQKTLYYGGIAVAGYLFYTQTLEYLSKGKLQEIFAPLAQQSKHVKEKAHTNLHDTIVLDAQVNKLSEKTKDLAKRMHTYQKASSQKHVQLSDRTQQLEQIQHDSKQQVEQLNQLLNKIDIPLLTNGVKEIERTSKQNTKSVKATIKNTVKKIAEQMQTTCNRVGQAAEAHAGRAVVNHTVTQVISSDADSFFTKVLELAQSIYMTSNKINEALELASRIQEEVDRASDSSDVSDSEVDSESDTDGVEIVPRRAGSSRGK